MIVLLRKYLLRVVLLIPIVSVGQSYNLVTTNPTQKTVEIWDFLHSQYGKKMLTGVWTEKQYGGNENAVKCSGKQPAIWGQDMNSWHSDRNGNYWKDTWRLHINEVKIAYKRGQIIQVNWHWQGPHLLNNGVYSPSPSRGYGMGAWSKLTKSQWNEIVTKGTNLYNKMIEDIDYHVVNFLQKLVDDKGEPIPILFRPLHEIDGGWFWWTCDDPSKTVELWNIMFDRIQNHHKMKNLIWVWSNGVECNGGNWPPYQKSEYPRRKAFYPGDDKCDIIGIDLYGFDPVNRGYYRNFPKANYRAAWNVLKAISSTKMIAMCEAEALPNAEKFLDNNYSPWLYCLPWYTESYTDELTNVKVQLCDWNKKQFNHSNYITANQIILSLDKNLENINELDVILFPNPIGNKLFIKDIKEKIKYIEIIDVQGITIKHIKGQLNNIDLSDIKSGMYFIRIQTAKSQIIRKILKKDN